MRSSSRARNVSLHVHPGGVVEIVAPARARPAEIEAFVSENKDWIRRARQHLENEPAINRCLPDHIYLRAIDRTLNVEYGAELARRSWLEENESQLKLVTPRKYRQKGRKHLRSWLASTGRGQLVPWLRRVSQEIGIDYLKTQVRGQKTRWGSCSARGTISINFCLLFLAPELVRYLFIHELCHRRHFDHSPRYWDLVERFAPDYETLDTRLAEAWRDVPGWVL